VRTEGGSGLALFINGPSANADGENRRKQQLTRDQREKEKKQKK